MAYRCSECQTDYSTHAAKRRAGYNVGEADALDVSKLKLEAKEKKTKEKEERESNEGGTTKAMVTTQ